MDCYIPGEVTQHQRTYSPVLEPIYSIFCDSYDIFESQDERRKNSTDPSEESDKIDPLESISMRGTDLFL